MSQDLDGGDELVHIDMEDPSHPLARLRSGPSLVTATAWRMNAVGRRTPSAEVSAAQLDRRSQLARTPVAARRHAGGGRRAATPDLGQTRSQDAEQCRSGRQYQVHSVTAAATGS